MTRDEEIRLGERAAQLLQDEVLTLAFANLERDHLNAWRTSPARDTEGREAIYNLMRQIDAIKAELDKMAQVSRFEKARIEKINSDRAKEAEIKRQIARDLDIPVEAIQD